MRISALAIGITAILFAPGTPAVPPLGNGNDLTATVELRVPGQAGPLQIVGFKMPEKLDGYPIVVLRILSTQATRAYWFRVRIVGANPSNKLESAPLAGDFGPGVTGQDRMWPNENMIAPGAEGQAHVAGLNGYQLLFVGAKGGCSCLRAFVQVSSVEFADGSSWDQQRATNTDPGPIEGATEERLLPCQESHDSAEALKDLSAAGPIKRERDSAPADGTIFRAFSFKCTLQQRDGRWFARCPI
ncbi:MAG: hypothetical protein WAN72_26195 [Candidatus Acidiferrales bacterium]